MSRTLRAGLNESNPNHIDIFTQEARFGDFLARMPRFRRVAVVNNKIVLPDDAKAEQVLNCYVTAGTVSGRFSPVYDSTPATTQVSTDAVGDIVFLSTDAVTEAEITYLPFEGELVEETVPVVSNLASASASRRILCAVRAEALAGTVVGVKALQDRAATPSTGQAAQNKLGTGVLFATADAVTLAKIKYIACPGIGSALPALGVNLDSVTRPNGERRDY